jgi:hypothetical protein
VGSVTLEISGAASFFAALVDVLTGFWVVAQGIAEVVDKGSVAQTNTSFHVVEQTHRMIVDAQVANLPQCAQ